MSSHQQQDLVGMKLAIGQAKMAAVRGERPFGTSIWLPEADCWTGAGGSEKHNDPTLHCEIEAIRRACHLADGLLYSCTMYTTHEPCTMCIGAIQHSKLHRVVWGSARHDLPELFRSRDHGVKNLLRDTTIAPKLDRCMVRECTALFDDEVRDVSMGVAG